MQFSVSVIFLSKSFLKEKKSQGGAGGGVREDGDQECKAHSFEPLFPVSVRGEAALSQCSNQGAGCIAGGSAL